MLVVDGVGGPKDRLLDRAKESRGSWEQQKENVGKGFSTHRVEWMGIGEKGVKVDERVFVLEVAHCLGRTVELDDLAR